MIGWITTYAPGGTVSGGTRKIWDLNAILEDHGFQSVLIDADQLRGGIPGIPRDEHNLIVVPEVFDAEMERIVPFPLRKVAFVQNGYLLNQSLPVHPYEYAVDLVAVLTESEHTTELLRRRCPRLAAPIIRTHSSGNGREGRDAGFSYGPWPRRRRVLYFEYKNGPNSWTGPDLLESLFGNLDLPPGWELMCLTGRTDAEIAELMRTSAIFAAPNRKEGMCASTSEAMISGCVIVGWTGGGAAEYLRGRAVLAQQDDVEQLRRAVAATAMCVDHSPEEFADMTHRFSDWFQCAYSREAEIAEICAIARRLGA
jgi:hypothetical protein